MAEETSKKSSGSFWRELPFLLVVAVVVALLVRGFVLQTFYIPSESMEMTLVKDDRVLVNKLVYDFRSPHRGEVIVFEAPQGWRSNPDEKDFIKRVIGVGGDHVVCCNDKNQIMINGVPLDESSYVYDQPGVERDSSPDPFDVVVPKDRLWVMGDHRYHSGDSREHYVRSSHDATTATISVDSVVGRAFVLFWPFDRARWLSVPDSYDKVSDPPS
ncbi:signal peptidase I [Longispora fulva]|uniref:signal peptidase I n=1 Tax=Longispora fulva TaxID=619741 RepID=UPI0018C9584C|nr:signal peptidase I [Longispora fulva]